MKPTSGLVSILSGDKFVFEAGTGYVCNSRRVIIAPACAGINFMLMAFGMAVFTGVHHMKTVGHRFAWLMCSLLTAYVLTLSVNALRILLSIQPFHAAIFSNDMTWRRIHRLEGIVIYFFFQYFFYIMIQKVLRKYMLREPDRQFGYLSAQPARRIDIRKIIITGLTPCAWYLAVTVGVPFLNRAPIRIGGRFYDHAVMVLGLCLLTWFCIVAAELCGQGVRLLITGGCRKHEAQNSDR
jgi:exosortase K